MLCSLSVCYWAVLIDLYKSKSKSTGQCYRPCLISKKNESSIKLQVGQSSKNIKNILSDRLLLVVIIRTKK